MARILIVDDSPDQRENLKYAARGPEREVVAASSAKDAVQKIAAEEFDVVVTDLRLETKKAGLDVLRAAKEKDASIQVIVCTAFGTAEISVEAMGLGAFDYLERNAPGTNVPRMISIKIDIALKYGEGVRAQNPSINKEVFVSYAWTDKSKNIVDRIETALKGRDIVLLRDARELNYRDPIRAFMERLGRGKCIVVILSKAYLESKNCMFEMIAIADRQQIHDRVFPIILDDADIHDGIGRANYLTYWEQKGADLDAAMKKTSLYGQQGIREEIDLLATIRSRFAAIIDILGDMNALTPEKHLGTNFQELLQQLETRLAE